MRISLDKECETVDCDRWKSTRDYARCRRVHRSLLLHSQPVKSRRLRREKCEIQGNTFRDNIGMFRTLQSHHTVGSSKRVDGRAHVSAKVPFFQGIDSEIHLPGVIAQRVLRHHVLVTGQQFLLYVGRKRKYRAIFNCVAFSFATVFNGSERDFISVMRDRSNTSVCNFSADSFALQ